MKRRFPWQRRYTTKQLDDTLEKAKRIDRGRAGGVSSHSHHRTAPAPGPCYLKAVALTNPSFSESQADLRALLASLPSEVLSRPGTWYVVCTLGNQETRRYYRVRLGIAWGPDWRGFCADKASRLGILELPVAAIGRKLLRDRSCVDQGSTVSPTLRTT